MHCPSCNGAVTYNALSSQYYCSDCGLEIETEPKYRPIPAQHYSVSYILSKEKLGCRPPTSLPAFRRLKAKGIIYYPVRKEIRRLRRARAPFQLVYGHMRLPRSLRDAAEFEYKTIILKGQLKGRDSFAMALAAIVSVCSRSSVFRKTAPVMEALEIGFRKFDSCHSLIAGAKYDLKKETSALNDALELCRLEAAYTP